MTVLEWNQIGDRVYETGIDRGVLYLNDGRAVPWNGLTSVREQSTGEVTSVYYDGVKINDLLSIGGFEGSLRAITYPDEFLEVEGYAQMRSGAFLGNQPGKVFNLSYRNLIGNDVDAENHGYKIHILYNVTAVPSNREYRTISGDQDLTDFEWDISAVPQEVAGFRPTAHVILDSRTVDPWLLSELEAMLYGTSTSEPELLDIQELATYMDDWRPFVITDNGDGTVTISSTRDDAIEIDDEGVATINNIKATYSGDGEVTLYEAYEATEE